MQLHVLLLLYYLVPICRKLTVIYRQLGNNNLIQLLWAVFIHLKLGITSAKLVQKHNEWPINNATLMKVLDIVTGTSK